jgi:hypothetical protein
MALKPVIHLIRILGERTSGFCAEDRASERLQFSGSGQPTANPEAVMPMPPVPVMKSLGCRGSFLANTTGNFCT